MRWYYPYKTGTPHGLKAWKRPPVQTRRGLRWPKRSGDKAELAWSGGHRIRFRGMRIYPESFPMRHYLFLSIPHAIEKYVERQYDSGEIRSGWHQWRARITPDALRLPAAAELREYQGDSRLDPSDPRMEHYVAQWIQPGQAPRPGWSPAGDDQRRPNLLQRLLADVAGASFRDRTGCGRRPGCSARAPALCSSGRTTLIARSTPF